MTAMGYDRYMAICNPLRYSVIMSKEACIQLATGSLGIGLSMAIVQVTSVFGLPFCDAFVISHFFCDVRPLLKLACIPTELGDFSNTTEPCGCSSDTSKRYLPPTFISTQTPGPSHQASDILG